MIDQYGKPPGYGQISPFAQKKAPADPNQPQQPTQPTQPASPYYYKQPAQQRQGTGQPTSSGYQGNTQSEYSTVQPNQTNQSGSGAPQQATWQDYAQKAQQAQQKMVQGQQQNLDTTIQKAPGERIGSYQEMFGQQAQQWSQQAAAAGMTPQEIQQALQQHQQDFAAWQQGQMAGPASQAEATAALSARQAEIRTAEPQAMLSTQHINTMDYGVDSGAVNQGDPIPGQPGKIFWHDGSGWTVQDTAAVQPQTGVPNSAVAQASTPSAPSNGYRINHGDPTFANVNFDLVNQGDPISGMPGKIFWHDGNGWTVRDTGATGNTAATPPTHPQNTLPTTVQPNVGLQAAVSNPTLGSAAPGGYVNTADYGVDSGGVNQGDAVPGQPGMVFWHDGHGWIIKGQGDTAQPPSTPQAPQNPAANPAAAPGTPAAPGGNGPTDPRSTPAGQHVNTADYGVSSAAATQGMPIPSMPGMILYHDGGGWTIQAAGWHGPTGPGNNTTTPGIPDAPGGGPGFEGYKYDRGQYAGPGYDAYQSTQFSAPGTSAYQSQTFNPGQMDTYKADQISQYQAANTKPADDLLMQNIMQLLQNPGLSPQWLNASKEKQKDAALQMQDAQIQQARDSAAGRGMAGSGFQAGQERRAQENAQSNILGGYRDLDLQAAEKDQGMRLAALQGGQGALVGQDNRNQSNFQTGLAGQMAQAGLNKDAVTSKNNATDFALKLGQANADEGYRGWTSGMDVANQKNAVEQTQAKENQYGNESQRKATDFAWNQFTTNELLNQQQAAGDLSNWQATKWTPYQYNEQLGQSNLDRALKARLGDAGIGIDQQKVDNQNTQFGLSNQLAQNEFTDRMDQWRAQLQNALLLQQMQEQGLTDRASLAG